MRSDGVVGERGPLAFNTLSLLYSGVEPKGRAAASKPGLLEGRFATFREQPAAANEGPAATSTVATLCATALTLLLLCSLADRLF